MTGPTRVCPSAFGLFALRLTESLPSCLHDLREGLMGNYWWRVRFSVSTINYRKLSCISVFHCLSSQNILTFLHSFLTAAGIILFSLSLVAMTWAMSTSTAKAMSQKFKDYMCTWQMNLPWLPTSRTELTIGSPWCLTVCQEVNGKNDFWRFYLLKQLCCLTEAYNKNHQSNRRKKRGIMENDESDDEPVSSYIKRPDEFGNHCGILRERQESVINSD